MARDRRRDEDDDDRRESRRDRGRRVPKPSDDSVRNASQGSSFKGWIKPEYEDMTYKPQEGKNRIRILAWLDGAYFGMQVKEHRNIGINRSSYLCMSSVINKKRDTLYDFLKDIIDKMPNKKEISKACAVCEDIADKIKSGKFKGKDIKNLGLYPTARTLYLIVDRDNEDKGVQIWPAPYWKIDEELRKRLIDPEDGSILQITDPEEGYDVYFEMEIEKTSDGTFPTYTAVQVARKPSSIDPSFYEKIIDLREVVIIPTYKEIAEDYETQGEAEVTGKDKKYEDEENFKTGGRKDRDGKDEDTDRGKGSKLPTAADLDDMTRKELEDLVDEERSFFKKIAKDMDDMSTKDLRNAMQDLLEDEAKDAGKDDGGQDCFGKDYGKYRDCDSTCPDRRECKLESKEGGGEKEDDDDRGRSGRRQRR